MSELEAVYLAARREALYVGVLPREFEELTPADWAAYRRGLRDRAEDAWALAAWIVLQCAGTVARPVRGPLSMATLIPRIWLRRERRREAAEAERKRVDAERRRLDLPPLSDDEE